MTSERQNENLSHAVKGSRTDDRAAALGADEGLALDPVYTAKAMAGLLALRAAGRLGDPVLFVHIDEPS